LNKVLDDIAARGHTKDLDKFEELWGKEQHVHTTIDGGPSKGGRKELERRAKEDGTVTVANKKGLQATFERVEEQEAKINLFKAMLRLAISYLDDHQILPKQSAVPDDVWDEMDENQRAYQWYQDLKAAAQK